MALSDSLLAYYSMEGNANDAVGSNNGTSTNITYSTGNGKILQGGGYNGSTSKIALGAQALTGGAFTISAWVNFASFAADCTIYGQGNTGSNNPIIALSVNDTTTIEVVYRNNSSTGLATTYTVSTLSTGTWYYFAWTCSTTQSNFYLNGSLAGGPTTFTANSGTFDTCNIGVRQRVASDNWMNGAIDEVGIWTRDITSAEVTQLYNAGDGLAYPFPADAVTTHNLLMMGVGT